MRGEHRVGYEEESAVDPPFAEVAGDERQADLFGARVCEMPFQENAEDAPPPARTLRFFFESPEASEDEQED